MALLFVGCRIHRLYPLKRCKTSSQKRARPWYDTKLHLMMRFQSRSSGECGVHLHWHYSPVNSEYGVCTVTHMKCYGSIITNRRLLRYDVQMEVRVGALPTDICTNTTTTHKHLYHHVFMRVVLHIKC